MGEALAAILGALRKYHVLGPAETLPEPFCSAFGEAEQARGYFFDMGGERIVAARLSDDPGSLRELWREIELSRARGEHAALLPLAGNAEADGVAIYADGQWIGKALRRLGLLEGELPHPRRVMSGLAGYSRLYLFHLPGNRGGGLDVLVKFDRPDRLRKEWEAIEAIRRSSLVPPEVQLPHLSNSYREDGVFVMPMFQNKTVSGEVMQLAQFLENQLLTNRAHVRDVLDLVERFLRRLYLDAAMDAGSLSWRDLNAELGRAAMDEVVQTLGAEGIAGYEDEHFGLRGLPAAGMCVNPLFEVERRMKESTGRLLKATTHGDLQSTNILVALGSYAAPEEIAIIDIEKLAADQPVVEDLVRIEADFWRSVYTEIAGRLFREASEDERVRAATEAMVLALDRLECRTRRIEAKDARVVELADAAGSFVFDLRRRAWSLLRGNQARYWPRDYFGALRFYYLKAMLRPLVNKNRLRLRVALVGASMAEETVRAMEQGRITGEHDFPGAWEDYGAAAGGRSRAAEAAGGGGAEASPRGVAGGTAGAVEGRQAKDGALGAATSVFSQRGLILTAIRQVVEIGGNRVVLKKEAESNPGDLLVFPDAKSIDASGVLNAQAFRRQRWAGTGAGLEQNVVEKTVRNESHFQKNPHTVLLVKAGAFQQFQPADEYIGYTHVIPLTQAGYNDYYRGGIEDNLLGADVICAPEESARALLLFSFAMDTMSLRRAYKGLSLSNSSNRHLWMYAIATELVRAMAFHVSWLMKLHANVGSAELLTQNDTDRGMQTVMELLGFEKTPYRSGDGHTIRSVLCKRGA
jgi:hypothetical protein